MPQCCGGFIAPIVGGGRSCSFDWRREQEDADSVTVKSRSVLVKRQLGARRCRLCSIREQVDGGAQNRSTELHEWLKPEARIDWLYKDPEAGNCMLVENLRSQWTNGLEPGARTCGTESTKET